MNDKKCTDALKKKKHYKGKLHALKDIGAASNNDD
jgi:hypothetical protein